MYTWRYPDHGELVTSYCACIWGLYRKIRKTAPLVVIGPGILSLLFPSSPIISINSDWSFWLPYIRETIGYLCLAYFTYHNDLVSSISLKIYFFGPSVMVHGAVSHLFLNFMWSKQQTDDSWRTVKNHQTLNLSVPWSWTSSPRTVGDKDLLL